LCQFLNDPSHPRLQFEAAWVLTNVASGSQMQTHAVINAGGIKPFIAGLRSPYADVQE